MRTLTAFSLLALSLGSHAIEQKPIKDVDATALTQEGQVMDNNNEGLDLIWWLPPEFWAVTLTQSSEVTPQQVEQVLGILRPYSVLAVVQANISSFGSFTFLERDAIMDGLSIELVSPDGTVTSISHTQPSDPDLRMMLDQMRPILAAAMGNMGQNFFFFPLPDVDEDGNRIMSPYEKGVLRVRLGAREDVPATRLEIELPLDSLFVPRICPNGKPAHISWAYCPWKGEKL